jgi:aldehyde:ferredoxin oxidoreductase
MLGIHDGPGALTLLEEMERHGFDVVGAGVAIAWATEAFEKGFIGERETLTAPQFGNVESYRTVLRHMAYGTNDFYRTLTKGSLVAAAKYGGSDFACVLGQEMAGYATGEVYFVSQAYGFRHSHLDSAGYSYDQTRKTDDVREAVNYLIDEERKRVLLTCMVSCLFARSVYTEDMLSRALTAIGRPISVQELIDQARNVQIRRWKLRFATGYKPEDIRIPKRFSEISTNKGPINIEFMNALASEYPKAIQAMVDSAPKTPAAPAGS